MMPNDAPLSVFRIYLSRIHTKHIDAFVNALKKWCSVSESANPHQTFSIIIFFYPVDFTFVRRLAHAFLLMAVGFIQNIIILTMRKAMDF